MEIDSLDSTSRGGKLADICKRLSIDSLYPFQEEALKCFLSGKDAFILSPTSSGKSLCYLIPAMISPGTVLVVSPLIALMGDQVDKARRLGISAYALSSNQDAQEKQKTWQALENHLCQVLFISPERLALPSFQTMLANIKVSLLAVDEAHCVNQWGENFRPEYSRIPEYLHAIYHGPTMALTATANSADRQEIASQLAMREPRLIFTQQKRPNIKLQAIRSKKQDECLNLLLQSCLSERGQGLIYSGTRKLCHELRSVLEKAGLSVDCYHGGMAADDRERSYRKFLSGHTQFMVATKAFGMGIHKDDIRFVYHLGLPKSIEEYTQEVGRAGRDGSEAKCRLFFTARDYHVQKYVIEKSFPGHEAIWACCQVAVEIFKVSPSISESELFEQLRASSGLSSDEVRKTVETLYRERYFARTELVQDSWSQQGFEIMVSLSSVRPSVDSLCQTILKRKEDKLTRLKEMYELAKAEKDLEPLIHEYFA